MKDEKELDADLDVAMARTKAKLDAETRAAQHAPTDADRERARAAVNLPPDVRPIADQLLAHLNTPGTDAEQREWAVACAVESIASLYRAAALEVRAETRERDAQAQREMYAEGYGAGLERAAQECDEAHRRVACESEGWTDKQRGAGLHAIALAHNRILALVREQVLAQRDEP